MRTCMLMTAVLLAACATTKDAKNETADAAPAPELRETEAAGKLKARLASMPACAAGVDVGVLELRPTICTKRFCKARCCNACGWKATLQTMSGVSMPVDEARVRAALQLGEGSAYECEIAAWTQALAGASVGLDGEACVVR